MRARSGETFEIGKCFECQIDLAGRAAEFVAAHTFEKISGELAGLEKFFEREMRINAGGDDVGEEFFAALENYSGRAAVFYQNFSDGRFRSNLNAGFARGVGDGVRNGARAAAAESPGAEGPVNFAHVMVKKNVSGARRTNAEKSADDTGGGHGGFEDVGFEPLVEEIGGAHGHKLDEGVALIGGKFAEALQQKIQLLEIFGIERGGVGRDHGEHGLHETAHGRHHFGEFVVGFGVQAGVTANIADGFGVIVNAPEVVAAGHGRKSAVERKNFEAVTREIEFTNDFRAEE